MCLNFATAFFNIVPLSWVLRGAAFNRLPVATRVALVLRWELAVIRIAHIAVRSPAGDRAIDQAHLLLTTIIDDGMPEILEAFSQGRLTTVCTEAWHPDLTLTLPPQGPYSSFLEANNAAPLVTVRLPVPL
jgi:hypothetical protein